MAATTSLFDLVGNHASGQLADWERAGGAIQPRNEQVYRIGEGDGGVCCQPFETGVRFDLLGIGQAASLVGVAQQV